MFNIPETGHILLGTLMEGQSMNMICQHIAKILQQHWQTQWHATCKCKHEATLK